MPVYLVVPTIPVPPPSFTACETSGPPNHTFSLVGLGLGGTSPRGLQWNSDGTQLTIFNDQDDYFYRYTASTPYDLSTLGGKVQGSQVPTFLQNNTSQWAFNATGSRVFLAGNGFQAKIEAFDLGANYDLTSTLTHVPAQSFDHSAQETSATGFAFNNDGTKFYLIGFSSKLLRQYSVPTPYDLSVGVSLQASYDTGSAFHNSPRNLTWSPDGTTFHIVDRGNNFATEAQIREYTVSTPFDIGSTVTFVCTFDYKTSTGQINPWGLTWNADGSKFYVTDFTVSFWNAHEFVVPA